MKRLWNSISFILVTLSFLFFFTFNFQDVFAAPTRNLCHSEQRDALLELKNEFKIQKPCFDDGFPKTESWGNNSDCCSWNGIACDANSGDVIKLNLSSSCLYGQVNSRSNIFRLQNLRILDLSDNNLSGQILSSLRNLSKLTILDISENHFKGQIPSSLGNLSKLTILDISENHFKGQIPSSLSNLSHLTTLSLSVNDFVGEIPSSLGNLSHLTILFLGVNDFVGEIPSSLGNLPHLTDLALCENDFVGEIPTSFENLSHLTFLELSANNLVGEIPSFFGKFNKLVHLSIELNNFIGNFPLTLLNLTNLSFLSLYNNELTGKLPPNMSSLSNLEFFYAEANTFTGTLPSSLLTIPSLTYFDLSYNQLDTLEFGNISSSLAQLCLANNNFRGQLPGWLWTQPNLGHVDLTNNNFTGFERLTKPARQPSHHSARQPMMNLYISNNKMEGQVPGWLWTLPNLGHVDLSNNTFTGFERLAKPTRQPSIVYLFGANNNFTGNIPSFICAFQSLAMLDLSNNKFNGSIPRCMGNFSGALEALYLRKNHLSGGLPENISASVKSLDVGHNQLVGKLPRSLVRISFLEVLNVESNKINDTFPFWLGSLQELQVLVLRSNAFHGPIQQTGFSKLRIIDISHNHFTGTLPSYFFVTWTAMFFMRKSEDPSTGGYMGSSYYSDSIVVMNKGLEMEMVRILKIFTSIDFSGNKFEGEIPKSIGLLKELHVLNLSSNAFTGHIPSTMANLRELESLDVSKNKLSGEIPQELGILSYLEYMNFSHNQLVGQVPGSTQFLTQNCSSFEGNPGLFGPSLEKICVDIHGKTYQQSEMPDREEDEEEVISWIAAAIGFIPGIYFGLTMGYIFVSYKPEWFINPFGRKKRRSISTRTH